MIRKEMFSKIVQLNLREYYSKAKEWKYEGINNKATMGQLDNAWL